MAWWCHKASAILVSIGSGNRLSPIRDQAITLICTVKWTSRHKLQRNCLSKKVLENVTCKMAAILLRPQYVINRTSHEIYYAATQTAITDCQPNYAFARGKICLNAHPINLQLTHVSSREIVLKNTASALSFPFFFVLCCWKIFRFQIRFKSVQIFVDVISESWTSFMHEIFFLIIA